MSTTAISTLRTVVVGLGRIGYGFHCPSVASDSRFKLVGLVDPLLERRNEAALKFGAPAFDSLDAVFHETEVDLVVVASPTSLHAEHVLTAFRHGAHVFCDKPVARSLDEFDEMAASAEASERRFVAYQPCRFLPELHALRDLIKQDLLGPLYLVKRSRCGYERRKDWQAFKIYGGGLLSNYGSHCLDEVMWLLQGEAIAGVHCQTRTIASAGDADDYVKGTLTTEHGVLIDLEISQAAALTGPTWEIFGASGAARYDAGLRSWQVRYYLPAEAEALKAQTGLAADGRLYQTEILPWRELSVPVPKLEPFDYYDALWRHLVQNAPPPVTVAETRSLLELLERCHRSATTGTIT